MVKKRIVIVGACRTPIDFAGGGFKNVPAHELLRTVFKETILRTGIDDIQKFLPTLDGSFAGTCIHLPDALNIGRVSTLLLGLPEEEALTLVRDGTYLDPAVVEKSLTRDVPGVTVSFNCGSGATAVIFAVRTIKAGDGDIFLVGGVESMSHAPYMIQRNVFSYTPGDAPITDSLLHGLKDPLTGEIMGVIAERTAKKYGITREDQDRFAVRSHQRAHEASSSGKFESQIVPVNIYEENVLGSFDEKTISKDKCINQALTFGMLAATPAKYFFVKDGTGTVTYGNTCRINDGASSFLVMTLERAQELGLTPEAEVVNYGTAALDPSHMGEGPICVIPPVLGKVGMKVKDVDFFEINEAFAATTLAVQRSLDIPDEKLNVYGGAIALGHPVGATGAILTTKAINILKDSGKEHAMISMCVGNGQGIALLIRNFS